MNETPTYWIEVLKKPGLPDGRASALLEASADLGLASIEGFRVGALYHITGALSQADINKLAANLLTDPVAEDFLLSSAGQPSFEGHYTIRIGYHPGVTDSVAGTVEEAFVALDLPQADRIDTGMVYHLTIQGEIDKDSLGLLCEKVLANPVIQHYEVYDSDGQIVLKG
jgi:phosphoribosylformylglycinamidine (FGAM) synthase PurS component